MRALFSWVLPAQQAELGLALRHWVGLDPGTAHPGAGGLLYVDDIAGVPLAIQRHLLQLADQLALSSGRADLASFRPVSLAIGTATSPEQAVEQGRILAPLLDRVDKVRLDLGTLQARRTSEASPVTGDRNREIGTGTPSQPPRGRRPWRLRESAHGLQQDPPFTRGGSS